ncbi:MAG: sarcosine oxidase subunit beta family protein [Arenicellales bacterium]|nr:sarcosine oxidase subunit beta family protein [Arenicellales bacterium]
MRKYSVAAIVREALRYNAGWERAWRSPEPKKQYDAVIIGAGGHGLATAYYLGKNHGIKNVAIIEKGWLGGGNTGRNTTIIRSNYLQDSSAAIYEKARSLYETLSQELNYNVMFSPRGVMMLAQTEHEIRGYRRTAHANNLQGVETEFIDPKTVKKLCPIIELSGPRFPVLGALWQPRGGTARHDAVAWGYARGADQYGVDILQNREVIAVHRDSGKITGVETTRGLIKAKKVGFAVAGNTSRLWRMTDLGQLPIESHKLQAFVSEPLKPLLDHVVVFGVGGAHFYISQSDKGGMVFGGDLDWYKSYAQRGNLPIVQDVAECATSVLPCLGRVRLLRHWSGVMDMSMDGSAFICKTPISNLYLNAGWNYGGFKASPASGWFFADLIANDRPDPVIQNFTLDRFSRGINIDERGAGPDPKLHG